ncbi:MAG: GNAT family N-acetyltransferase [Elusimicrobiota bacterium]
MTLRPAPKKAGTARISLRLARASDDRLTWGWVRHPSVWKQSFSGKPIPWKTHRGWFRKALAEPGAAYLIAESPAGTPVGQVRFEAAKDAVEISIVVARRLRGLGLGTRVLTAACRRHFQRAGAPAIIAHIRPSNSGSVRAFLAAGFVVVGTASMKGVPCFRLAARGPEPRTWSVRHV